MKRKRALFAIDREGRELYIHVKDCGISTLVVMCDGMRLTYFGTRDGPYLKVGDVIDWYDKEAREDPRGRARYERLRDLLRDALAKFRRGEIEESVKK
jgi:hypothetical protein